MQVEKFKNEKILIWSIVGRVKLINSVFEVKPACPSVKNIYRRPKTW